MKRNTTIMLIRCAILLAAIVCGVIGVNWYRDEPKDITLDLLRYTSTITKRIAEANEFETSLLAEGRDEETYTAFDIRRNIELDWQDVQGELRKFLGVETQQRLFAYDILTEPEAVRADADSVKRRLTNRTPAYSMLGSSMLLLIGTLVVRPVRDVDETAATPRD